MGESANRFATTQWTLVWKAAEEKSGYGKPALAEIVRRYWQPLYTFARQRGLSSADAEDATQEFLCGLLNGKLLGAADPAKGKFRTFLLTAWKRFLVDQFRKQQCVRSGGQFEQWEIDVASGEKLFQQVCDTHYDLDRTFMLAWAKNLLLDVNKRVENDYKSRGHQGIHTALLPFITKPIGTEEYDRLAKQLSMSVSSLKVALHRLRQRFGESLREVIAETVEDQSEIDLELLELLEIVKNSASVTPS
jgi:DNA-directed RNA polymerase specialized sigma24 family protein